MNTLALSLSAIILYIAAVVTSQLSLIHKTSFPPKYFLLLLGALAVSLHGIILYQGIDIPSGLNLGFFNAASLAMWMIALLLLLTLLRNPVENLAILLFPLAALTIGLEGIFHAERILPLEQVWGVRIHIFSSFLAYGILTIAAFQALFLAIQDRQLHNKHPGWTLQLFPPLQVMETLLFRLIVVGFLLLSISLITGFMFFDDIFEEIVRQHLVHKTILSIVAWIVFAVLLWGRWRYGWRGKKAIRWNLSGFVLLVLAYFGSKLVLELILERQL